MASSTTCRRLLPRSETAELVSSHRPGLHVLSPLDICLSGTKTSHESHSLPGASLTVAWLLLVCTGPPRCCPEQAVPRLCLLSPTRDLCPRPSAQHLTWSHMVPPPLFVIWAILHRLGTPSSEVTTLVHAVYDRFQSCYSLAIKALCKLSLNHLPGLICPLSPAQTCSVKLDSLILP